MRLMRRPIRDAKGKDYPDVFEDLAQIVNGGISYGDGSNPLHLRGSWVNVVNTGLVNTEFSVSHTLGKIPVGFHVFGKDQAGDIYRSGTAWTDQKIFLKCSVANVTNLLLFIV